MTVHPTPKNLAKDIVRQAWPKPRKKKEPRFCSVDGCSAKYLARGLCSKHYARWAKTGSAELQRISYETCTVGGCERKPRSGSAEHCEMHYYRLRRTGTTDDTVRKPDVCVVDGCSKEAATLAGLCRMHHLRLKIRGDLYFRYGGAEHHLWVGPNASYSAVHSRLRRERGRASSYRCVDCGKQARQWSYSHSDPNERVDPHCGPYSPDPSRYSPRCVSCHKKFDLARVHGGEEV